MNSVWLPATKGSIAWFSEYIKPTFIFSELKLIYKNGLIAEKIIVDEHGKTLSKEPFNSHIVCCGNITCWACGRQLHEKG